MATKAGRATLRDIRQGRTLWTAVHNQQGKLTPRPRRVGMGLHLKQIGVKENAAGDLIPAVLPVYSFGVGIYAAQGMRILDPELDVNIVRHEGRLHLRNLFVNRRACQRFIDRVYTHRGLANAECNGFRSEELALEKSESDVYLGKLNDLTGEVSEPQVDPEELKELSAFIDAGQERPPSAEQRQAAASNLEHEATLAAIRELAASMSLDAQRIQAESFIGEMDAFVQRRLGHSVAKLIRLEKNQTTNRIEFHIAKHEMPNLERVIATQQRIGRLRIEVDVVREDPVEWRERYERDHLKATGEMPERS